MLIWSKLGGIGNTSIAKLTILAPLIGTYILYNDKLTSIIATRAVAPTEVNILELASKIHAHSVEFLYFGLILMGLGTFTFQAFSPRHFKVNLTPESYANSIRNSNGETLLRQDLAELARAISGNDGNSVEMDQAKNLIKRIFSSIDFSHPGNRKIIPDLGRNLAVDGVASGKLIADRAIKENPLLFDALVAGCGELAFDVHYCNYQIQDKSRPRARFFTTVLMGMSIMLFIVPTVATSAIILGGLI